MLIVSNALCRQMEDVFIRNTLRHALTKVGKIEKALVYLQETCLCKCKEVMNCLLKMMVSVSFRI